MTQSDDHGPNEQGKSRIVRARVDAVALRVYFRICYAWKLDDRAQTQILGLLSEDEMRRWRSGDHPRLQSATVARIGDILAIYRAIFTLLPDHDRAHGWMLASNAAPGFGGRSATEIIASGELSDIATVRDYLLAQVHCA